MPNRTAPEFKADTSTEICLRYTSSPTRVDADLVVNDHADVDGFATRCTPCSRATPARAPRRARGRGRDGRLPGVGRPSRLSPVAGVVAPVARPFPPARRRRLLRGGDEDRRRCARRLAPESPEVRAGWETIERGCERIERGAVRVEPVTRSPRGVRLSRGRGSPARHDDPGAQRSVWSATVWLWPQVRNRAYGERVQLVLGARPGGWLHDVWAPSYSWPRPPTAARFPVWSRPATRTSGSSTTNPCGPRSSRCAP